MPCEWPDLYAGMDGHLQWRDWWIVLFVIASFGGSAFGFTSIVIDMLMR